MPKHNWEHYHQSDRIDSLGNSDGIFEKARKAVEGNPDSEGDVGYQRASKANPSPSPSPSPAPTPAPTPERRQAKERTQQFKMDGREGTDFSAV